MGTGVTLSTQPPENFFGSGDLAVWACKRIIARTAKQGQSPRYGTLQKAIFDLSDFGL